MIFNSKDELIYKKVKENTIKSQIKRKNNIIVEIDYGFLAENFNISGNKIKKEIFCSKGKCRIPIIILKGGSGNEYQITILFDYKKLKKNNIYFAEYSLLKLYDKKTWDDLLFIYQNKK